jgi:cysteine desulfurase/selenocysteine lyase
VKQTSPDTGRGPDRAVSIKEALPPAHEPLDPEALKAEFPALHQTVHGKPLVYLDSAASSQKPQCVIDAISHYYEHDHANVHRGTYELSIRATNQYEDARGKVARFLGAPRHEEIVFTKGTTESINLVASAWGRANLSDGDAIVVTEMEHHSNLVPWHLVAGATGAEIRAVRMSDDGQLDLDSLDDCLRDGKAKIVAFQHVSNAVGTIHPVAEITRRAKEAGAAVLIDGAQAAPQMPLDVRGIGCDFYAFSGHKMCGPTGIGVLWGRRELLEAMPPYQGGGEMIDQVWVDRSTYRKPPQKFEAGTPPIAGAIGLGVAVDFLTRIGMDRIHEHEKRLARLALEKLAAEFEDIRLYGPGPEIPRAGVISFTLADIHPHDLATILDHEGIAIRAGHHCCQPLMRRLGIAATGRTSFYLYNEEQGLEVLIEGLKEAGDVFRAA